MQPAWNITSTRHDSLGSARAAHTADAAQTAGTRSSPQQQYNTAAAPVQHRSGSSAVRGIRQPIFNTFNNVLIVVNN
jgi:hypothetical protein